MAAPDDGFVEVALRVAFRMRIVDAARVVERDIQVIPPPLGRERDRHIADAVLPRLSRLRRRSLVLVPETLLAQTPVDELPRGRTTTAPALAPGDLRPDQWLSLAPSTAAGLARVDGAAAVFTLDEVSAHRSVSPRLGQRPQREADPLPRSNTPAEDGFFAAAERGDRDGVLVALGADVPVAARSAKHGGSALHLAAGRGREEVVAELLRRGAVADALAANGSTPLMWAAGGGHDMCVERLLDAGADPHSVAWTWERCTFGRGSGQTAAHWAAESNQPHAVRSLITQSPTLAAALDERGRSPLALAQVEGAGEVEALLQDAARTRYVLVEVEPA